MVVPTRVTVSSVASKVKKLVRTKVESMDYGRLLRKTISIEEVSR